MSNNKQNQPEAKTSANNLKRKNMENGHKDAIKGSVTKKQENNSKANKKISTEETSGLKVKSKTKDPKTNGSAIKESNSVKKEEIEKIASKIDDYFSWVDDFCNSKFKKLYADVIKSELFSDPLIAFSMAERILSLCFANKDKIALTTAQVLNEFKKRGLNDKQKILLLEWFIKNFKYAQQKEGTYINEIVNILKCHVFLLKKSLPKKKSSQDSLVDTLKTEIERLPITFSELKPEKRLAGLIRLLPYIQLDTISSSSNISDSNNH